MSAQLVIPIYESDELIVAVPSYNVEGSTLGLQHQELLIGKIISSREETIFQCTYLTEQDYNPNYVALDDLSKHEMFRLPISSQIIFRPMGIRRLSADNNEFDFFDPAHYFSVHPYFFFRKLTNLITYPYHLTHPLINLSDADIAPLTADTYPITPMYLISSVLLPYEPFSTIGNFEY